MAETPTQVTEKLRPLLQTGFRGNLTARGAARAMIWRSGITPADSPPLGESLTQELLSYGFGILRTVLRARSLGIMNDDVVRGFEVSAEAIESVVKNGDPEDLSRGFYRIVAAASYHLARYSARAFSLIAQAENEHNLSKIEKALSLLILRELTRLYNYILDELTDATNSDNNLAEKIENENEEFDTEDALVIAATENYLRALAAFLFALRGNEPHAFEMAEERLTDGERLAFSCGLVSIWWIYRLTKFLIGDLWAHSIQRLLPQDVGGESNWSRLRDLFVASLIARNIAELDLWPSQVEITKRLADSGDDIVASLPTSAGKTRIAELCILRALATGHRVVFVTPLRALSAQTERTLRNSFGPLGFDISSMYGSAGASYHDLDSLANRHIVVATPEKLDFALRNNPNLIDDVSLLVLDEGHMLGPSEREVRYEVLIQRLLRRADAANRRIVCLSAMLPSGEEMDDFVTWLRSDEPGTALTNSWRPTRQRFGQVIWKGNTARYELKIEDETTYNGQFIKRQTILGPRGGEKQFPDGHNDLVIASAWKLAEDNLSVLIYCPEKRSVKAIARRLLTVHKEGFLKPLPSFDPLCVAKACAAGKEWLGESHPALKCLQLGVGIHHADFPKPYLKELDNLIAAKQLHVIVASPTLARGLNISASCVLFQSLYRFDPAQMKRRLITIEEFSNVAGRAGRAYVDLDGQVLGICSSTDQLQAWRNLVLEQHKRKLESGLIRVTATLILDLQCKLGKKDVSEYIINSSTLWTTPPTSEETTTKRWNAAVEVLDIALLSLLGEEECTIDNVSTVLDNVLSSSFLYRRLHRYSETNKTLVRATLVSRAKHICQNASLEQRRGYFFSGIGLTPGHFLDLHSGELNANLLEAEEAFEAGDKEKCLSAILRIAERVFQVSPFTPAALPDSWKQITKGWLTGLPMENLQALDNDAVVFVEEGLVYKLAWAIEAIRVRSRAHEENIFGDRPSKISSAIEAGTISLSEALLIQSGLNSRTAATKALTDYPSEFSTRTGMLDWLGSEQVLSASLVSTWPTKDTREAWLDFLANQSSAGQKKWGDYDLPMGATFDHDSIPAPGSRVFVRESKAGTIIYTPDMKQIGTSPVRLGAMPLSSGIARVVSADTITLHYIGPLVP